jgi:hypothetical protein
MLLSLSSLFFFYVNLYLYSHHNSFIRPPFPLYPIPSNSITNNYISLWWWLRLAGVCSDVKTNQRGTKHGAGD